MKRLTFLLVLVVAANAYAVHGPSKVSLRSGSDPTTVVDVVDVNGYDGLVVAVPSHVSTVNSTAVVLGAGATFTGDWEETLQFNVIVVTVRASHASATNGLMLEFSSDGVNVDSDDVFTIPADMGKTFSFQTATKYYRVNYTNGATPQTFFRLQTVLKPYTKSSSHRAQDDISSEDDAELVKATLAGEDQDNVGTFKNVKVSTDGYLAISNNSSGLAIAEGNVTGKAFVHKFGNAPDFDTGDGEVTVWDGAEDAAAWENMVYDYSTTAAIDSVSSSSASDTVDVEVQGLDANYDIVNQTVTLNGQNRVALDTNLIRVFRAFNANSTDLVGHVFVYENVALSGGIPTNPSLIRIVIHPENNQTEMAVYTIPDGKTGYLRSWYVSTAGASKTSEYIIRLKSREFNKVFRLKHKAAISDTGSSHIQHNYIEPEVFLAKTDLEMTVEMTASGGSGASISAGFDIVIVDN